MNTTRYTLWSLDVWGNEDDGFEVNDRCCLSREFVVEHIDTAPTDEEIRKALVSWGYLKPRFRIETDGDDALIFVNLWRNGFPLFELNING